MKQTSSVPQVNGPNNAFLDLLFRADENGNLFLTEDDLLKRWGWPPYGVAIFVDDLVARDMITIILTVGKVDGKNKESGKVLTRTVAGINNYRKYVQALDLTGAKAELGHDWVIKSNISE